MKKAFIDEFWFEHLLRIIRKGHAFPTKDDFMDYIFENVEDYALGVQSVRLMAQRIYHEVETE